MKIAVLSEDTSCGAEYGCEHGLSVYVETDMHRILADTGASGLFAQNAERLGIDLTKVDTVVLSHGHYDHGGGIMTISKIAPDAVIYARKGVFGEYYHGDKYIGIDKRIRELKNLFIVSGNYTVDNEMSLFSDITGQRMRPDGNRVLTDRSNGSDVPDRFSHEQCLVISNAEGKFLLSGCAHNGIINILDRYREIYGGEPDVVISGFHMTKKTGYTEQEKEMIIKTAEELSRMNTVFYTGHCTGMAAYELMKPVMGEKLRLLQSGMRIEKWK